MKKGGAWRGGPVVPAAESRVGGIRAGTEG
jgi:hypothetical protein